MYVLITQPRYMPSFEMIHRMRISDLVIFMDNTQLDTRGYERRTKVKCGEDEKWLTIPVNNSEMIKKAIIPSNDWRQSHKDMLMNYYRIKNPIFEELLPKETESYKEFMNEHYELIKKAFGLECRIKWMSDIVDENLTGSREILEALKTVGAKTYITGDNAKKYGITPNAIARIGCKVVYLNFKERKKMFERKYGFDVSLSVLDALNTGLLTIDYGKTGKG